MSFLDHNSKGRCKSKSSSNQQQPFSIISLSKLKSYMPQAPVAPNFFTVNPLSATYYKQQTPAAGSSGCSIYSVEHSTEPQITSARETIPISSESSGTRSTCTSGKYSTASDVNSRANQELIATSPQESAQSANSISHLEKTDCFASASRSAKEAESRSLQSQVAASKEQHLSHLVDFSDSKRGKKIHSIDSKAAEEDKYSRICGRDNMTPSSSLFAQNYSHIDAKHQHRNSTDYNISASHQNELTERQATHFDSLASDRDLNRNTPDCNKQPAAQAANSSLMSESSRQFKLDKTVGNSSIQRDNSDSNCNNPISVPSATSVDSTYSTRQDSNHGLSRRSLDSLASHNINIQHQNYQGSSELSGPRSTANTSLVNKFAHYSQGSCLPSHQHYYHQNLQASMLSQQIKIEQSMSTCRNGNVFEHSTLNGSNQQLSHNLNSNASVSGIHKSRCQANQYYNEHYSLGPAISSKSSSPNSANTTPSPKMNAMHMNSQHSGQLVISGLNHSGSVQSHLGHHNYINSASSSSAINHSQHPHIAQHYNSYSQPSAGASNQHHLLATNHEQIYPQQTHNQHQHQQHHQLHIQQSQHQHHPHQLQHQSVSNQQSIYHHLASNAAANVNQGYSQSSNGASYQTHLQNGHQTNLMASEAQQNHLNTAAAACAAAAVVSQTLKTVASQHNQQHQYPSSLTNSFNTNTGNLMNIASQGQQQFHDVNLIGDHIGNQATIPHNQPHHQQHQVHQNIAVHHTSSITTRKYQCKMCPQVFMSKAEMKYHNQNHMREAKPYKCLQCPKAFANSSYLSQHMRIHQGVKPYTCDICSRKFTQLSHLQQHKRTHTGDKPYKCNYMNCTKQFSQLSNLQSHSRCHQLDKPYKCNSCYKCFHDEPSLLEHIPRHLESKHLKKNLCIFCGSSYQQERGLVKHFQQYHTDKSPTLVAAAIAAGTTGNTNLIASLVSSTQSNVFATPSSSSSSSISSVSSSCSINSSGSLNSMHGTIANIHGLSAPNLM